MNPPKPDGSHLWNTTKPVTWRRQERSKHPTGLTSTQRDTLHWLDSDRTLQQIADVLGTTRKTVDARSMSLFKALDVHTRADAVRRGRELGVLPMEADQ